MECPQHDTRLEEYVHNALLNFTVGYILKEPEDVDEYGLQYFVEANAYQENDIPDVRKETSEDVCDVDFMKPLSTFTGRRCGVCFDKEWTEWKPPLFEIGNSDKRRIKLFLTKLFPFKLLDDSLLNEVIDRMVRVIVNPGDAIMRQGDEAKHFFIIEKGVFEEWVTAYGVGSMLFRYDSWGCFGMASLIFAHNAPATVITKSTGALWALNCAEYRSAIHSYERNRFQLKQFCLLNLPFISKMSNSNRDKLVDGVETLHFKNGDTIISNSTRCNGLYYIKDGKVLVTSENNEREASVMEKDAHFGELSMFCNRLTTMRAKALQSSEIYFLSASAFERLIGPFNQVAFLGRYENPLQYDRCSNSVKIRLFKELSSLIALYNAHKPRNFLRFGIDHYKRRIELKSLGGYGLKDGANSSQTFCNEYGDLRLRRRLSIPEPEFSVDSMTYTIKQEIPTSEQIMKIKTIMKSMPIFGLLGDKRISDAISSMQHVHVYTGHYVVKSGNLGHFFYVVEDGHFKTLIKGCGVTHEILDCPDHFGELGLFMDVPRFADVIATSEGSLWALSRDNFRRISADCLVGKKGLNYKLVKNIKSLALLREYDIKALSFALKNMVFKDRQIIHAFQEDSCGIYFVKKGTVRVFSKRLKNYNTVVTNGESFGCLTYSAASTENFKAQSIGAAKVALLPISAFEKLLEHCRKVIYQDTILPSEFSNGDQLIPPTKRF